GNQRTLEASCKSPSWKRFLSVTIKEFNDTEVNVAAVESNLISWISAQTAVDRDQILLQSINNSISSRSCNSEIRFRFPFRDNKRTVELSCPSSGWKVFVPITYGELDEGVHTAVDLKAGHVLTPDDLKLGYLSSSQTEFFRQIDDVVGSKIIIDLPAGTAVSPSQVDMPHYIFVTRRAYEPGEIITRDGIARQLVHQASSNSLRNWPSGIVTAVEPMESGQTITKLSLEESEYVVVSVTNIIRGQVITSDLVDRLLHPKKTMGAQTLSTLDEALGLEATRTIRAGSSLTMADLTVANLIRKGEKVTLTVTRGALKITVDAIAMEDGKMGEQVKLTNAESGKVIYGIVTGRHQAKGVFP
ncbi:MAG: flagellar basal body P-ring formation chaperone FlgA, partial [Gammaproteobacteria bacterium]